MSFDVKNADNDTISLASEVIADVHYPKKYIDDGHLVSMGAMADTAAPTDTGTFSLIALFKRLLSSITSFSAKFANGAGTAATAVRVELPTDGTGKVGLNAGTNNIGDVDVLTVPAPLSTAGGGTEATALRVTVATDSTGVLSVDDNGSSLTIDAPVTTPAFVRLSDGASAISTLPVSLASVPSHAVTNIGTFAVQAALNAGTNNIGDVDVLTVPAPLSTTGGGTEATALRVTVATDSTGVLSVDDNGGSLTIDAPIGTPVNVKIGDGTLTATVRDTGSSDSLNVAIVDASGNQVTSFGGGTQYTEADTDASITGTAVLWEDTSDTLRAVSAAKPLPVNVVAGGAGDGSILDGVSSSIKATVLDYTNANPLAVRLTDTAGDYVTAGGGSQYTEGDTDASITGTALMMEGAGNALVAAQGTASDGLLVNLGSNNDVTVTGTVTANAGTNLNTSTLALETGGNLAGAATSLAVIDDWDESDRAKVNPIVGQAGVAAGSGTVGVTTQRVVLATDVALPAGTNAIGKLAANSGIDIGDVDITSIAAGDNNIGNVDIVTMPNVTLAAGTNTNEVVGDVAHDSPAAGNPVLMGGYASAAAPTDVSGDADAVRSWMLRNGATCVQLTAAGALIAGDASNGIDVDVTRLPALVASSANIGDVDVLTVPAPLSTTGGGTQATALRVTLASDSTGIVALTTSSAAIGKLAANSGVDIGDVDITSISAGDNNIGNVDIVTMPNVTLAAGTNTNEIVGDVAHDSPAAGNPVLIGGYASAAAPTDVSGDADVVRAWMLRNGARCVQITAAGALVAGDASNGLDVDVTRLPALVAGSANIGDVDVLTVPAPLSTTGGGTEATALRVTLATDSTGLISIDDNAGSLTVDAPAGTPVNVQIGDGTRQATVRDTGSSDSLNVAIVDGSGNQITTFGGGTEYTEDAAAAANPVGGASILVRADSPAAITTTDGDNVAQRGTDYGAAYCQIVTSTGSFIDSFGGGTQYTEGDTDASIAGTAMMMEGAGNALVAAQGTAVDGLLVNLGANNDITGSVTANAGTNLNTSLLALEAGGNLAGAATSLAILDDWDESDRAKVNPIAGQAGVQGGSGAVSALTQRVVLATDIALPAGTNNIGDVDVLTLPNVTLAAGTNTNEIVGDVAHDSPVGGNPVLNAGYASAAAPTNVDADGDVVRAWMLRNGASCVQITAAGALIAGDASNGLDVDVTRMAALVAGSANIGDVDVLTVPAPLSTTGGGTEATALRVTLANDSTGIVNAIGSFITCSTDVTRPADTAAYVANDCLSDSTTAPTSGGFTFSNAGRISGGSGIITDAIITTSADAGTLLQGEIWIFNTSVTNINDNVAFAVSDSEIKTFVGKIPFTLEDAGNNGSFHATNLNIGYTCSGSANLRFLIKVKNAYTPANAEVLTFVIKCLRVT